MEHENTGPDPMRQSPDEAGVAARLGELLRRRDAPPETAIELAKLSFGWRRVDAELAALVADSDTHPAAVAVRDDSPGNLPRILTFEADNSTAAGETAVEVEISGTGRHLRLLGQLHPPGTARIELRQAAGAEGRWVEADDHGRFLITEVHPGPVNLTWYRPDHRPVTTAWTVID